MQAQWKTAEFFVKVATSVLWCFAQLSQLPGNSGYRQQECFQGDTGGLRGPAESLADSTVETCNETSGTAIKGAGGETPVDAHSQSQANWGCQVPWAMLNVSQTILLEVLKSSLRGLLGIFADYVPNIGK